MNVFTRVVEVIVVVLVVSGTMATAAPLKIGVTWPGDTKSASIIAEAFHEKLTEHVPEVEIDLRNAPDAEAMGEIIAGFEREKDGIVVLRRENWLLDHPPAIPTFIASAGHPERVGLVKNMMAPEGNITGVTLYTPLEPQFEIFQALIPNLDAMLLLKNAGGGARAI